VGRAALVAAAVIVADQVAKAIVRANIEPGETVDVIPGLHLVHTKNTGVAFSLFSGGGPLVVIVALIALGALVAFFITHVHRRLVWLPTGLLVGGAAGNLIDRIRIGSVTAAPPGGPRSRPAPPSSRTSAAPASRAAWRGAR